MFDSGTRAPWLELPGLRLRLPPPPKGTTTLAGGQIVRANRAAPGTFASGKWAQFACECHRGPSYLRAPRGPSCCSDTFSWITIACLKVTTLRNYSSTTSRLGTNNNKKQHSLPLYSSFPYLFPLLESNLQPKQLRRKQTRTYQTQAHIVCINTYPYTHPPWQIPLICIAPLRTLRES